MNSSNSQVKYQFKLFDILMGDDEWGGGGYFQRPRNQIIINLAMKTTMIKYCKILNDWDQYYNRFYH